MVLEESGYFSFHTYLKGLSEAVCRTTLNLGQIYLTFCLDTLKSCPLQVNLTEIWLELTFVTVNA
jgi:hypothetical protein